jgi:hypothetical protein
MKNVINLIDYFIKLFKKNLWLSICGFKNSKLVSKSVGTRKDFTLTLLSLLKALTLFVEKFKGISLYITESIQRHYLMAGTTLVLCKD